MALFRDAVCVIVSMGSPRNTGWDSSHTLVTQPACHRAEIFKMKFHST